MTKTHISWVGTIASIAGSFLVAFGISLIGFSFFTVGSISWLYVGVCRKDKSLILLNSTFFVANIIGLSRMIF